jgi:hypothetical protein
VFDEVVQTQFESRTGWQVLWASNEVIWHSERDNWGQLYLYDLQTGQLKNKITTGEGPVMQIARVDEASRTLWFGANGREPRAGSLLPALLSHDRSTANRRRADRRRTHTSSCRHRAGISSNTYSKPDLIRRL